MLELGIISAYPDEDWHAGRILEAARRVAEAEVLSPLDFSAAVDGSGARLLVRGRPHAAWDAFLTPRALGADGDHELQLELYRTLTEEGALLVNAVGPLTLAIDKFKTGWLLARAGLPTPPALVTQRLDEAVAAVAAFGGRAVVKPLYGSLGIGVELLDGDGRRTREHLAERLARTGALYVQAWADGGGRDVRAFVVGDVVEAVIARVAPPGEFRTNVHQGGRPQPAQLDDEAARIAVAAARVLGLDYAGVDLVETAAGPVLLEVNGTPLFRGILEATGRDMAEPIVAHAVRRAAHERDQRQAGQQGDGSWRSEVPRSGAA